MNNNLLIETNDAFEEAANKFKESSECERLRNKFRLRTYGEKYATLNKTARTSSTVIAAMSILTGIGFVYMLLEDFIPFSIACMLAPIPLILVEIAKRQILPTIFRDRLQFGKSEVWMMLMAVMLTAGSIGMSFKGTQVFIKYFSPQAQLVSIDSIKSSFTPLFEEIDALEATASGMTWRGKIVSDGRKILNETAQRRSSLQESLLAAVSAAEIRNISTSAAHASTIEDKALYGAIFQLILEILLIICLRYNEVYDWKSITQFAIPHTTTLTPDAKAPHPATIIPAQHEEVKQELVPISAQDTRLRSIPFEVKKPVDSLENSNNSMPCIVVKGFNHNKPMTEAEVKKKLRDTRGRLNRIAAWEAMTPAEREGKRKPGGKRETVEKNILIFEKALKQLNNGM